jgi:hypothetical protein
MLIPNARIRRQGADGRADAVILDSSQVPLPTKLVADVISSYNEITSVAGGSTANVLTYIVPVGKKLAIRGFNISGDNIAVFNILINSDVVSKHRTYYTEYNLALNSHGLIANSGDTIFVQVENFVNSLGSFNASMYGELIND